MWYNVGMKPCAVCGNPVRERSDREVRYCSIPCFNVAQTKRVVRPCRHCGVEFLPPRNHPQQPFCSVGCRDSARTLQVTVKCAWCGQETQRKLARSQKLAHAYCSRACQTQWRLAHGPRGDSHVQSVPRVQVLCDFCGEQVLKIPSRVRAHNFCGPKCRAGWQAASGYTSGDKSATWLGGGVDYRGPNWDRQASIARERDGGTCQRCGSASDLRVHHIKPYQTFATYQEANDLRNLTTICRTCHAIVEWEYRRAHPGELRRVPCFTRVHTCRKCGADFVARSPRTLECDLCRKPRHVLRAPSCPSTLEPALPVPL